MRLRNISIFIILWLSVIPILAQKPTGQAVINKTRSLDLVDVKISETPPYKIALAVINTSELAVIEIIVSIQDELEIGTNNFSEISTGFIYAPLEGGKSWVLRQQSTSFPSRITIEGILFEDGTGEGNWKKLRESLNHLEGLGKGLHEINIILLAWLEEQQQQYPVVNRQDLAGELISLRNSLDAARDELVFSESEFRERTGAKAAFFDCNYVLLQLEKRLYPSDDPWAIPEKPIRVINDLNRFLDSNRVLEMRLFRGPNGVFSKGRTKQ